MAKWPVFICYRQIDGMETATRIYELLNNQNILLTNTEVVSTELPILDVYFDQAVAAAPDWKSIHRPHLERSKAMIVVCSPGAFTDLRMHGDNDWVHEEIEWWLENDKPAPIVIDPLGLGQKWIPKVIIRTWPDIQAIAIVEKDWESLGDHELNQAQERARTRLIKSIVPSAENVYQQELEAAKGVAHRLQTSLQRTRIALYSVLVFVLLITVTGGYRLHKERLESLAEESLSDMGIQVSQYVFNAAAKSVTFPKSTSQEMFVNAMPHIANFEEVGELYLADAGVNDISLFSTLNSPKSLVTLILQDTQVNDISPLQHFKNLKTLFLANTEISDISPLRYLTRLSSLTIYEYRIRDLSTLDALTNLSLLTIRKKLKPKVLERLEERFPDMTIFNM